MLRFFMIGMALLLFAGCSQNSLSVSSNLSSELQKQKEESDNEVRKLEEEIAKLERDKEKYRQDYENFDNNAILDELDETLKDENTTDEVKEIK